MLRWLIYAERTGDPLPPNHETAILAIEAEARADLLAQIEKAVRDLDPIDFGWASNMQTAVLSQIAAIRSAAPVEPT